MMIKVFTKDSNGKISFTPDELKKLLDEAYWEGYNSTYKTTYTYSSPSATPYSWTCDTHTVTLSNISDVASNAPLSSAVDAGANI